MNGAGRDGLPGRAFGAELRAIGRRDGHSSREAPFLVEAKLGFFVRELTDSVFGMVGIGPSAPEQRVADPKIVDRRTIWNLEADLRQKVSAIDSQHVLH